jgi:hypothetical protein
MNTPVVPPGKVYEFKIRTPLACGRTEEWTCRGQLLARSNFADYGPDFASQYEVIITSDRPFVPFRRVKKDHIVSARPIMTTGQQPATLPDQPATATADGVIGQWKVASSTGRGHYTVTRFKGGAWMCECPHHIHRKVMCKHIEAVRAKIGAK